MSFIRVGFFFGREFRGVRRKVVVVGVLGSGKVAFFFGSIQRERFLCVVEFLLRHDGLGRYIGRYFIWTLLRDGCAEWKLLE